MVSQIAPPSRNPADNDTFSGMFRLALEKFLQGVDDMLPARVIAYDRTTNVAQVQPLIVMVTTQNEQVPRAQIASMPVYQYGSGGWVLSFPVATGDLGWIKANDRDISLFMQSGLQSPPNTQRKHSFEDAMFFPDAMRTFTLDPGDIKKAVLQNKTGTVKIALSDAGIEITVPTGGFTINGKNVSDTHIHSGVQPGSGDSGPPI